MNFSHSRTRFHRHLLPLAVSAAVGTTGVVSAQTLEEVVVTATKREESVMDVPLAITVLPATSLPIRISTTSKT